MELTSEEHDVDNATVEAYCASIAYSSRKADSGHCPAVGKHISSPTCNSLMVFELISALIVLAGRGGRPVRFR